MKITDIYGKELKTKQEILNALKSQCIYLYFDAMGRNLKLSALKTFYSENKKMPEFDLPF